MPDFNLWVQNGYPFRHEEWSAIQEALQQTYGGQPVYIKVWPEEYVSLKGVTKTRAAQMALTLQAMHRQAALKDKNYGGYGSSGAPSLRCEVEVHGKYGKPGWLPRRKE